MIQAGAFVKQLTAPQIPFSIPIGINVASLPIGALPSSLLATVESIQQQQVQEGYGYPSVAQCINGKNAYLYGFEVSYQQHLNYLPGVLGGLRINANYSYTGSQEKGVPLRTYHPRMIDQATNTWNFSPTYDTKRFFCAWDSPTTGPASSPITGLHYLWRQELEPISVPWAYGTLG
jgi:hypothetical protein